MQLAQFKLTHARKDKKRIGRGGKRGTTSGRGTKGQKSRAGHGIRPAERDLIKQLPKLRGYRFKTLRHKPFPLNVGAVNMKFSDGAIVSPKTLLEHGLVRKEGGALPKIKLLGDGEVTKVLHVQQCRVSASAKTKIEKAGGAVMP